MHRLQIKVPPFVHEQDICDLEELCRKIEIDMDFLGLDSLWIQDHRRKVFEVFLQTVKSWGRREYLEWKGVEQVRTYVLRGSDELIKS